MYFLKDKNVVRSNIDKNMKSVHDMHYFNIYLKSNKLKIKSLNI